MPQLPPDEEFEEDEEDEDEDDDERKKRETPLKIDYKKDTENEEETRS